LIQIRLFGYPSLTLEEGTEAHTPGRGVTALLAYLLEESRTGQPHTREKLAELLWPYMAPEHGRRNLRQTLYELNRNLPETKTGPVIVAGRQDLRLNPEASVVVDTIRFDQALQAPSPENLQSAVELYQDGFLADFYLPDSAAFEAWASNRRAVYQRRFRGALLALISADPENAVSHARRLYESDPLDEEAARILMELLARNDARADALQLYETVRRDLDTELDVEPEQRTTDLFTAISRGELPAPDAVRDPPETDPDNDEKEEAIRLPGMPTPFIGRRDEVSRIIDSVRQPGLRLLTLLGPGGTGKTRLSIEAALGLAGDFPDGVAFISLASAAGAEDMFQTIARPFSFTFFGDETPVRQLGDFFREKRLLLVLDNFEHLAEHAGIAADLLAAAPELKIMATSRIRLNLLGEQLYTVGGLELPTLEDTAAWNDPVLESGPFSAIQLFLDRAVRVRPGFRLDVENIHQVIEICRLVEGLPLGIELAAAWLEILPVEDIVSEIRRSLDFLETDLVDVPERQRSIRAVFESSWKLLEEPEREAVARFSVFRGSFTREAAQYVCSASMRTILGLANKSWIQPTEKGRFQIHELLRQYGHEKLTEDDQAERNARDRHAEYYADFVYEQGKRMETFEQIDALDAIALEDENILPCWEWLLENGRFEDLADQMCTALSRFNYVRRVNVRTIDLFRRARTALEARSDRKAHEVRMVWAILSTAEILAELDALIHDARPIDRLKRLWEVVKEHHLEAGLGNWNLWLIAMHFTFIDPIAAEEIARNKLVEIRETGDPFLIGWALLTASNVMGELRPRGSEIHVAEALRLFHELGVTHEQGICEALLGSFAVNRKRFDDAVRHKEAALRLLAKSGDPILVAQVTAELAKIQIAFGNREEGFGSLRQLRTLAGKFGDRRVLGFAYSDESLAASRYSTLEHARETRMKALQHFQEAGIQIDIAWNLWELGEIDHLAADPENAQRLYDQAYAIFSRLDHQIGLSFYERGCGELALSRGDYPAAKKHFEQSIVHAKSSGHVWSLAYAQNGLGRSILMLGDADEAGRLFRESIRRAERWNSSDLSCLSLLGFARLWIASGEIARGVETAALVASAPIAWNDTKKQAQNLIDSLPVPTRGLDLDASIQRGRGLLLHDVIAGLAADPEIP